MSNKQITVPSEYAGSMLDLIEQRIREIGKSYQANGQSYQDDLEITAFLAMARQLGFDLEVRSCESGFMVTRHAYKPAE
ncbi:TPA: hypothetical protein ACRNLW_002138 [Pseudomonas aeruginosa]|uniref:hypothetical protein n=1 Tax=Pseudomonas aeruginosa TaxID=287 RepID=UPI0005F20931|nr:hypothetical protein [Pseudomonas aeruginosa]KJS29192.1 MAG: hypothetical protein VR76_06400 [Pseudomonas sp. BRH_c35]MBH8731543.1 hypothetical protein [Pseudomonas aeruginosa]MCS8383168.1 hypothetical protein [Pseudomonas aeruginosa]MCS8456776.1 hypothetical protein [Pseudomonas aeruginosa]MCS9277135.1 hypothetical protein [Pseudomonas aeruginosa]